MTDETIVDVEPTPEELEEKETPETDPETVAPETPEPEKAKKSKELASALAQKEHWRKKYEQLLKDKSVSQPKATDDEWKKKVEFLIKNRDYDEEEFDHIATVASRKGVSLEEAAKQESEYITFRREKIKKDNKTPLPSQAGFSSFEKKITPDMKPEEINKILAERAKEAQNSNTGY